MMPSMFLSFLFQGVLQSAPSRLLQLEFQVPEETFLQNVEVAERTITQEETQLDHKVPIPEVLALHKVSGLRETFLVDVDHVSLY